MSATNLKVLILRDGSKPYAENASGDVLSTFNHSVLGQLLLTTDTFELQPGLLKGWKWNAKEGSYDLTIKDNLTFHDGSPVEAQDLEFALLRGFFCRQRSFYEIYLGNILGAEEIKPGTKYQSGAVKGVSIIDRHTVRVKLRSPNPSFLYSLTRPYFSFTKRSALNDDLITWKNLPVGAGPYKVISEDSDKIVLIKRKSSSNGADQIELYKRAIADVKYDLSFFDKPEMRLYKTDQPSAIFTLFFTNQNELSKYADFRKSITHGIDRKALIEGDELSKVALEFLPSSFWRNKNIHQEYDLALAKKYFSVLPDVLKLKTWPIPVFSFGELSPDKKRVTERLKEQFSKFGFKVDFYPSNEKFLSKESATKSPLSMSGRVCNNVDPLLMFSSFKTKSPYRYDNSQNDEKYDALFEKAAQAVTTEDRIKTLHELSSYTRDHNFMVPLYENAQTYWYNPETIEGFGSQTNVITLFLNEIKMRTK